MSQQAQIIAFLSNSTSYGENIDSIVRLDTHCSHIFLAGAYAYKMKREVKYPFLDFSTLEKRHAAAANELTVNQRFSGDLYLGLSAVMRLPEGGLVLTERPEKEPGEVVEWLVTMRRFEQDALYSARAAQHLISLDEVIALADLVTDLHQKSPRSLDAAQALSDLSRVHGDNLTFFAERPQLLGKGVAANILQPCSTLLSANKELLIRRAQQGFYRHCHGDLHLANIVQYEGRPVAFDAIEFDDRLATIDIHYDLAFLLMDLWHYGLTSEANMLLNRYLTRIQQPLDALEGLALLPLFLALRALIRLKAAAWKQERASNVMGDRSGGVEIEAYAALALACLRLQRPLLIAIGGLSGTGKSSVARALAPLMGTVPGAIVVRSDVERKALFGFGESTRLPADAYREEVTAQVYERLVAKAERILAAGYCAIIDSVSARPEQRDNIKMLAERTGVPLLGFWLTAPLEVLSQRVASRRHDASDAGVSVVEQQISYETGPIDWHVVDASGDIAVTRDKIITLINSAHVEN